MKKDTVAEAIRRLPKPAPPDQDYPHKPAPTAPPATTEQRLSALEARVSALENRQMMMFYLLVINTALVVVTDAPRVAEIIRALLTLTIK